MIWKILLVWLVAAAVCLPFLAMAIRARLRRRRSQDCLAKARSLAGTGSPVKALETCLDADAAWTVCYGSNAREAMVAAMGDLKAIWAEVHLLQSRMGLCLDTAGLLADIVALEAVHSRGENFRWDGISMKGGAARQHGFLTTCVKESRKSLRQSITAFIAARHADGRAPDDAPGQAPARHEDGALYDGSADPA